MEFLLGVNFKKGKYVYKIKRSLGESVNFSHAFWHATYSLNVSAAIFTYHPPSTILPFHSRAYHMLMYIHMKLSIINSHNVKYIYHLLRIAAKANVYKYTHGKVGKEEREDFFLSFYLLDIKFILLRKSAVTLYRMYTRVRGSAWAKGKREKKSEKKYTHIERAEREENLFSII